MDYIKKADRILGELIKEGKRDFIIFPFGERGMELKQILNQKYGIFEKYIVDNRVYGSKSRKKGTEKKLCSFWILAHASSLHPTGGWKSLQWTGFPDSRPSKAPADPHFHQYPELLPKALFCLFHSRPYKP